MEDAPDTGVQVVNRRSFLKGSLAAAAAVPAIVLLPSPTAPAAPVVPTPDFGQLHYLTSAGLISRQSAANAWRIADPDWMDSEQYVLKWDDATVRANYSGVRFTL
jgi:hypothetical protein